MLQTQQKAILRVELERHIFLRLLSALRSSQRGGHAFLLDLHFRFWMKAYADDCQNNLIQKNSSLPMMLQ